MRESGGVRYIPRQGLAGTGDGGATGVDCVGAEAARPSGAFFGIRLCSKAAISWEERSGDSELIIARLDISERGRNKKDVKMMLSARDEVTWSEFIVRPLKLRFRQTVGDGRGTRSRSRRSHRTFSFH